MQTSMSITAHRVGSKARHCSAALSLCLLLAGLCCAAAHNARSQTPKASQARPAELEEAERLTRRARQLYGEGKYDEAIQAAESALALREKALGPEHPDVAAALNNLAFLYDAKRDYAKAEEVYLRSLAIYEKALGPEHPRVANSLNNLAALYYAKGDYAKAEPLYLRSLAAYEKAYGPENPDVAAGLNNLATLYYEKREYAKAEPLYLRALAFLEKTLGPQHPDVINTVSALAMLYEAKGDYAKAEPLFVRTLAFREKAFGPEHVEVANTLGALASLYRVTGDYTKAEPLSLRALSIYEKALGPGHRDVATALNNLGLLYSRVGDDAKAEPLYLRALSISEKVLGPEHPDVGHTLNNLAVLYKEKGDYAKAEPLYLRALAISEKAFGPEHVEVAISLNNLGLLYREKGDDARAEPLYLRALSVYEKGLGPDHPRVAATVNNLASLYYARGNYTRAEQLFMRSLALYEKALGAEHPSVALSLNNLGLVQVAKGDYGKAESLYLRSLAAYEKALGPNHPDSANTLNNLASFYEARGDYARAVQLSARAEAVRERNLSLALAAGSERQKLAYLAKLLGETDAIVSLHARSAPSDPQALELAFRTVLRRKGRALDAMSDQVASLRKRLDPRDREILDQLSAAQSQLSALLLSDPGGTAPEEHRAAANRLGEEVEQLQDAVSRRSSEFGAQVQPVTVERVRQALPAGAALVEFFSYQPFDTKAKTEAERFGPPRYVAYVLRGSGEPRWVDLGDAGAVDAGVGLLRAALGVPTSKDVTAAARSLDERVMRPVRKLLGDARQVFVSPDGALNLVPFAALVDEQGKYLVETYSLTYLTSGRDLLRLQVSAESREPPLVIADPLFGTAGPAAGGAPGGSAGSEGRRSGDMGGMQFIRLPGTAEEAQALGATLPGARVLTRASATESAIKQVSGPRVLHVATHGFFLPGRLMRDEEVSRRNGTPGVGSVQPAPPENLLLRSGLALEGANGRRGGRGEDGVLTALEATALDLSGTKLVVLSACETGVGEVLIGEGVYGLRRALVLAGSESQIMSLWRVSDEATKDLMVSYYKRLRAGEGRTEALRRVQLEMLRGGGQTAGGPQRGLSDKLTKKADRSHPYFWAAFIQSGDWRPIAGQVRSAK